MWKELQRYAQFKATFTTPTTELGMRLANSITNAFEWRSIKRYFWSDSTTVLTWITKDDNWSVFVKNRVDDIRRYSLPSSWGYILGEENPADLPSRGCKATHLLKTRWWEGPIWMKNRIDEWRIRLTCLVGAVKKKQPIYRGRLDSGRVRYG
ncbi:endonuclease [Caerostris extrusa]|uniref:Endonuclease n=1 Tax=Caerostris extrusa TaxID=172846 RepID=A0AAV4S6L3_CAEEX|nr:endonuclease [Caerostris extrusa]